MPLTEMPEHVRRFIVEAFESVRELEALLLLRTHRDCTWSPEDAIFEKNRRTVGDLAARSRCEASTDSRR